jgi:hypothetical protein
MKLLDDSGNIWMAHFHHVKIDHPLKQTAINGYRRTAKWASFCTLHKGECKVKQRPCLITPIFEGKAWCNPLDLFSRYVGRKLSLTRALALAMPKDKRARAAMWRSYWAHWKAQIVEPPPPAPLDHSLGAVRIAPRGEDLEVKAKTA